ncbi:hypothetical protein ABZS61_08600 [Streptomyces sp. NPDC005566]|uniref:hypothetical protein n=1 Tax=Streptomyces sp. NPDC005566 TaxID=3156886 RepID=UPI0033AC33CC
MGSRDADIDFAFTCPTTVRAVLDALAAAGWSAVHQGDRVWYMVNEWGDSAADRIDDVLGELDATANQPYTVALDTYHSEAKTGGMLMFRSGRTDAFFLPTIDRRCIPAAPECRDRFARSGAVASQRYCVAFECMADSACNRREG